MIYKIPITWQSYKVYEVEAENLQEAVTKSLKQFLSEPDDNYIDDSFEIDSIVGDDYPTEAFDVSESINKIH